MQMKKKRLVFVFPGDLETPTGGYIYDRRMIDGLRKQGWQVDLLGLGPDFPYPDQETVSQAAQSLSAIEPGVLVVMDGLALGVLPNLVSALSTRNPVVALIHHPLAFESGLSVEQADTFRATERQALCHAARVIVTGPSTARDLTQFYEVPAASIDVVCPGTVRSSFSQGSGSTVLHLLSVGSVTRRKGFDVLLAALYPLTDLPWSLSIAGDLTRDQVALAQIQQDIDRFGFEQRVHLLGAVNDQQLESLYQSADVFVLASRFEGYGMAYAEALAHGLPVLGTTGGAIPDTVPKEAGLLVPPDDIDRLTDALRRVILDDALRASLSQGAQHAALKQPTWEESSELFAQALSRVVVG